MSPSSVWTQAELTPAGRLVTAWRDEARTAVAAQNPRQLQSLLKELESNQSLLRKHAQKLLIDAACHDFLETFDILLGQPGVKTDDKIKDGLTALHIAAGLGHACGCAALLKHGAYVDVISTTGFTPLMFACMCGANSAVKILLEAGANPCAVSHSGLTPMKAALDAVAPGCATMILAYGGGRKRIKDPELKALPRSYAAARHGLTGRLISLLNAGEPVSHRGYDLDVAQEALNAGFSDTAAAAQAWRANEVFRRLNRQARPATPN